MPNNQIAKYSSDPRQSHGVAILYLVHYLKKMHNLGLKFKPDPKKGFKCYCDVDFSGNWNREFAPVDPSTAIAKWMDHLLCRMPQLMGLQTSISNCAVCYQD
jgi:hypothetical protein